ncbi:hypothetical protein DYB25_010584 [Aphanomyces astaci]|uniref:Inositol-tetrakisphosphate 1-kinase n=1 Tax=Aphanomyces astaci TaxID=112090 RepID=A0A397CEG9_APHAT|nr:hypothetical protein DYB25_010584 [Aphanomyces astaci]RHY44901.1 hypothetical protein DYB38_011236 [Aphanomyces astaci]RHY96800.1 hypothetical protein DYB26_010852 [Aphanomyces astaci]
MANVAQYRVGLILPLKKTRNGRMQELLMSQDMGIHFIHIDLDAVTSAQNFLDMYGPLDAILHKLAHDMVFEPLGDAAAIRNMQIIRELTSLHPNIPFIDPLESVRVLTDRAAVSRMLESVPGSLFHLPRHAILDSAAAKASIVSQIHAGLFPLPVLAKSLEACGASSFPQSWLSSPFFVTGTDASHVMKEYINHGGRLFKGYVLGKDILVAERTSLPDLSSSAATVEFNTQVPFPTLAAFETFQAIGRAIQATTGLSLFGFDVIVAAKTNHLVVVDVNYFPSFKEMIDFGAMLRAHVRCVIETHTL